MRLNRAAPGDFTCHSSLITCHFQSSIDEISKLPASIHTLNPGAIAGIIRRRIGELRGRDHVALFLHEALRENAIELDPETVLVPVLEDAGSRAILRRRR